MNFNNKKNNLNKIIFKQKNNKMGGIQ